MFWGHCTCSLLQKTKNKKQIVDFIYGEYYSMMGALKEKRKQMLYFKDLLQ